MIGTYVIVKDNKILGHYSGVLPSSPTPDGSIVISVPDPWDTSGEDIREYDANLKLRPLADRVAENLVSIPTGWKIVGENMEPMNEVERVKAGLDPRPKGQVLDEDAEGNPILRPATLLEQVANGDMTQATADTLQALNIRMERDALLAGCDWTQTGDQSPEVKALWAPYRQALRDVPEQSGFPWNVEWPISPDGTAV